MENIIHCEECNSENLSDSVYCCQCGLPMRKGIPVRVRKRQWVLIVVLTLILSSIMTAVLHFALPNQESPSAVQQQSQVTPKEFPVLPEKAEPAPNQTRPEEQPEISNNVLQDEQQAEEIEPLVLGTVSIINPEGIVVNEFPAVVVNGSWLALPTRASVGGDKWFFKVGNEKAIPIEGGLWGRGDAVGLWKLGEGKSFPGPAFTTWEQGEDVRFLSIKTGLLYEPMVLTPTGMQGVFIYSTLTTPMEPGVFIQNGKVVGWSFGELLAGAYMWVLGSRADLLYENYVDDFYNETFAGGREEYFSRVLARRQSLSSQRQLQMFAEAFRRPQKLLPTDTPRYLREEAIYPLILKLVDQIMKQGGYNYIAILSEEPLLWEVGSPELLENVALAIQMLYGAEAALNFLEGRGEEILRALQGDNYLPVKFHLELYRGLLRGNIDNGDIVKGWQNYNRAQDRFKSSLGLHLLGVELALTEGDWEGAENLLYQREYPPELSDRVSLLINRISDLKGFENKIVIKFQPGSGEIRINTMINESRVQDFLVDTGASYVTIPYTTVESLGLEAEMSPHQQVVQTAGGPVYAYAVILSSVELQGWIVSDVEALVIDLPNRPGVGLLGMNFLNRFNVDMQTDEGVLTLEPK